MLKNIFLFILIFPLFSFAALNLAQIAQTYNQNRNVHEFYKRISVGLDKKSKEEFKKTLLIEGLFDSDLPEVMLIDEQFVSIYKGRKFVVTKIDWEKMRVEVNGKTLSLDDSKSYYQNIMGWATQLGSQKQSSLFQLFVPRAEAGMQAVVLLGAALMVGALAETTVQLKDKKNIEEARGILKNTYRMCNEEYKKAKTRFNLQAQSVIDFFKEANDLALCNASMARKLFYNNMLGPQRETVCDDINLLKICMEHIDSKSETYKEIIHQFHSIKFKELYFAITKDTSGSPSPSVPGSR